jgi:hypothetical protein
MKRAIASLTLVAVLAGCSHVHPCDPASGPEVRSGVNQEVEGRAVDVTLSSGAVLWAENVKVGADSTRFSDLGRPSHVRPWQVDVGSPLPNSAIREISVRRHLRGALEGGAIGLVIGFSFGLLAGAKDTWFEPIDGGKLFGAAGLIAGLTYGALKGSRDVYDFTRTPLDR